MNLTPEPCPSRAGDKPHCRHYANRTLTTDPPQDVYVCCYCGQEHHVPQPATSLTYRLNPNEHGPHAGTVVRW